MNSPCNGVCNLTLGTTKNGCEKICEGCLRTPEEIMHWKSIDEEKQKTVLEKLSERDIERLQS